MKKVEAPIETFARIRVIGVGGSGGNAINHMIKGKLDSIEFISANTDAQDLKQSKAAKRIHLGKDVARGLGTGMNANLGGEAAEESAEDIRKNIKGADLLFIACGMGGGTGTGASPIIAKISRELGVLTVAVVTKPFSFEGKRRNEIADEGIRELSRNVDAIITIPNDKILDIADKVTPAKQAFAMSDDVLLHAVKSISDLITKPGDINIDFADIETIMKNSGFALMGFGKAKGENRAEDAVRDAIRSPLLDISIDGAKNVLFSISSTGDLEMNEVENIAKRITESVNENAKIIFGTTTNKDLKPGEISVTVVATSFGDTDANDGEDTQVPTISFREDVDDDIERIGGNDDEYEEEEEEQDYDDDEDEEEYYNRSKKKKGWFGF